MAASISQSDNCQYANIILNFASCSFSPFFVRFFRVRWWIARPGRSNISHRRKLSKNPALLYAYTVCTWLCQSCMASHWPAPAKHITQSSPSASVQACKTYSAHRESKNEGFTDKFFLTFLFGFCESSMRKRTTKKWNICSSYGLHTRIQSRNYFGLFLHLKAVFCLALRNSVFWSVCPRQTTSARSPLTLALFPHSLLSSAGLMKRSWPCPSARRRSFLLSIIKVG